jgi:hypothetical protein
MVVWQGITEGGTAVPVQVTEEGRVVAEGQEGPAGPPGPEGPQGPPGEYGPGDDVDLGNITASGSITAAGRVTANDQVRVVSTNGFLSFWNGSGSLASSFAFRGYDNSGNITSQITADGDIAVQGDISARKITANGKILASGSDAWHETDRTQSQHYVFRGLLNGSETSTILANGNINASAIATDDTISAAGNKCGFTSAGELYFTSRNTRYKLVVSDQLVLAEPYTRQMELREKAEAARAPRPTDNVEND